MMLKREHAVSCLLIAAIGFAAYSPALRGGFIWDDEVLIVGNEQARRLPSPGQFSRPISGAFPQYYRPLQTVSYQLDCALWQSRPFGFHLTSVALHVANALLVYCAALGAAASLPAAVCAAGLFAAHPINSEAINYISSRADLLYAFFLLLALNAFVRAGSGSARGVRGGPVAVAAGAFVLALLSKEAAVVFPLIAAAYAAVYRKGKAAYLLVCSLGIVSMAYLFLRAVYFLKPAFSPSGASVYSLALTDAGIAGRFVSLFLFPAGLHKNWMIPVAVSPGDAGVLQAACVFIAVFLTWRYLMRRDRLFVFGCAWTGLALLPSSSFLMLPLSGIAGPVSHAVISEAWGYFASAGFCVCLAACFQRLPVRRFIAYGLAAALAGVYLLGALQRSMVWSGDPVAFYREAQRYHPRNASIRYNLANEFTRRGQYRDAAAEYRAAIALNPAGARARNNLCNACVAMGDADAALRECGAALAIDPGMAKARYNLGRAYEMKGDTVRAREAYEKAVSLEPGFAAARERLRVLR